MDTYLKSVNSSVFTSKSTISLSKHHQRPQIQYPINDHETPTTLAASIHISLKGCSNPYN